MLKKPPEAQNVSEITSSGLAVFVSRFHKAPQAGLLLIMSGSFDALSKKTARVGETIIASRARIPEVPFWTKFQPAAEAESASRRREKIGIFGACSMVDIFWRRNPLKYNGIIR